MEYIFFSFQADLYTLERYEKKIHELLKRIPQDNMYCATACVLEREDNPKQTIYGVLTDRIEKSNE